MNYVKKKKKQLKLILEIKIFVIDSFKFSLITRRAFMFPLIQNVLGVSVSGEGQFKKARQEHQIYTM